MAAGTDGALKSGYLYKQGGSVKNWKKRYFVLTDFFLYYYKDKVKPKGVVDLQTGRGVRTKDQSKVQWPTDVDASKCFGLATATRTYYMCGNNEGEIREWKKLLDQVIKKIGKPSSNWEGDPVGKRECAVFKHPKIAAVFCRKKTPEYQKLSSKFPELVKALSRMMTAEELADKLRFSAGLITESIWEEVSVGGVAISKKFRVLMMSVLSQVELKAANYDKFVSVLKEFDGLHDIIKMLETV